MAAALGAEVELIACVGDDAFGEEALRNFEARGIATAAVRRVTGSSTGVAPILVDETGENRIVIVSGANAQLAPDEIEAGFAKMKTADVVLCQLEISAERVLQALLEGRRAGAVTILNPAPVKPIKPSTLRLAELQPPQRDRVRGAPPELAREGSRPRSARTFPPWRASWAWRWR